MTRIQQRRRISAGATAVLTSLLGLAGGGAMAQAPVSPAVAVASSATPVPPETRLTLVAKDVDMRTLLTLLFEGYGVGYSISPEARSEVTGIMNDVPLVRALGVFTDLADTLPKEAGGTNTGSHNSPLLTEIKDNVWTVRAKMPGTSEPVTTKRPEGADREAAFTPARTVFDVSRRVAAVLLLPGRASAILVSGPEASQTAVSLRVSLVKVSDRVPAGVPGEEPLTVTSIDKDGIQLTLGGPTKSSFHVGVHGKPPIIAKYRLRQRTMER